MIGRLQDGSGTQALAEEAGAIHRQYVTSHHDYWPGAPPAVTGTPVCMCGMWQTAAVRVVYFSTSSVRVAGEQLDRSYNWGGLDPRSHTFGASPAATPRDGSAVQTLLSGTAGSAGE